MISTKPQQCVGLNSISRQCVSLEKEKCVPHCKKKCRNYKKWAPNDYTLANNVTTKWMKNGKKEKPKSLDKKTKMVTACTTLRPQYSRGLYGISSIGKLLRHYSRWSFTPLNIGAIIITIVLNYIYDDSREGKLT